MANIHSKITVKIIVFHSMKFKYSGRPIQAQSTRDQTPQSLRKDMALSDKKYHLCVMTAFGPRPHLAIKMQSGLGRKTSFMVPKRESSARLNWFLPPHRGYPGMGGKFFSLVPCSWYLMEPYQVWKVRVKLKLYWSDWLTDHSRTWEKSLRCRVRKVHLLGSLKRGHGQNREV